MTFALPPFSRRRALMALAASGTGLGADAQAAWAPHGAVKIIVPLPAGGGPDIQARLVAEFLKRRWGQPVNIENRPGAAGVIGLKSVSQQSPADGHSLAYVIAAHITADLLSPQLDLLREFEPVSAFSASPMVLLTHAATPYRTLKDLVDAARAAPGKLTFGSGGVGSAIHMVCEQFLDQAGVRMLHVPYKGGLAATQGLMNGDIDFSATIPSSIRPLMASGRLRLLGSATPQRLAMFPDLPTVREQMGFDFEPGSWGGFALRRGTPAPIVAAWHAALVDAARDQAIVESAHANASVLGTSATPRAFEEQIRNQYKAEAELIRRLKIKPD